LVTHLDKIIEYKKEELALNKRQISLADIQKRAVDAAPARPFMGTFANYDAINIIAEIKKASPSAGIICADFKPVDIALSYEEGGAKALSVLTDEFFFQGSLNYLGAIKKHVKLPCLRKDFTIHEYHLYQARAYDADAVLLIAACLDDAQLKDYQALAFELGMACLVEVHDGKELERVLKIKPKIVGVNNRNLKTFDVSLKTSLDLIPSIPKGVVAISESGLKTREDLVKLKEAGYAGFLIGEMLMREGNVVKKLKELIR